MSDKKRISIGLEPADYARLVAEAERAGSTPSSLALDYVRDRLGRCDETDAERRRRVGLEALEQLAALTADLPPIDALAIARESRTELEQRSLT